MARGAPDYSNVTAETPLHRLDDQAELAARLGSPVSYDRAGKVVWLTDFRYGLQGNVTATSHAGCSCGISAARSHYSGFSLKLDPSADTDSYCRFSAVVQFILAGYTGMETIISSDTNPTYIKSEMFYYDGGNQTYAGVRYDPATGDWAVYTDNLAWETVLESFKIQQGPNAWYPIKLVADFKNGKYVRLQVAKEVVDISTYGLWTTSSPNLGQLLCRVLAYGGASHHEAVYVDAIIITQAEP